MPAAAVHLVHHLAAVRRTLQHLLMQNVWRAYLCQHSPAILLLALTKQVVTKLVSVLTKGSDDKGLVSLDGQVKIVHLYTVQGQLHSMAATASLTT